MGGLALVMLCLSVYLPGVNSIGPIDRDESRFAQASRQMFESAALPPDQRRADFHDGGWVIPKVQDRPRLNKPPLIYWLQVASAWAFTGGEPLNDRIWMYRLPSIACSTLSVVMTWLMGRRMFDPRCAWAAAAFLAICPVVAFDAHQARADQLLLATVVGAQACLWHVWKSRDPAVSADRLASWAWAGGLWICTGLSILAKGPIGPMVTALTCLGLCLVTRRWTWMLRTRPLAGLVILAAIVGPWVWLVGEKIGWEKYFAVVFDETIGRSVEGKEGHWAPPGYHTLLLAVLFWPGSMMTALGVVRALKRGTRGKAPAARRNAAPIESQSGKDEPSTSRGKGLWGRFTAGAASLAARRGGRDGELFCLAWIVPSWIVFELVGTKLPHYTLPMYPAVALLSARMLFQAVAAKGRMQLSWVDRLGFSAWWLMGCVLAHGVLLGVALLGYARASTTGSGGFALVASLAAVANVIAVWRIRPSRGTLVQPSHQMVMGLVTVATLGLFFSCVAPAVLPGEMTGRLMALVRESGAGDRELASEYHEDSLIYATRGGVRRLDRADVPAWLEGGSHRAAIVRAEGLPFFEAGESAGRTLPPFRSMGWLPQYLGPSWSIVIKDVSPDAEHPEKPR